jgi:hypothetical protein
VRWATVGWRDSRHEEVGGNDAPGEPRPPGLPSLIEGYALKILYVTIPSYAYGFALEEIAQAVSERGHRRALLHALTPPLTSLDTAAARQPETSRPGRASFHSNFLASPVQPPLVCHEVPTVSHEKPPVCEHARASRLELMHRGTISSHFTLFSAAVRTDALFNSCLPWRNFIPDYMTSISHFQLR